MASILFKWLVICVLTSNATSPITKLQGTHPFFVSVVELEHKAKEKSLQISCKIFTDDFEKTLRQNCNCLVDLLQPAKKVAMDKLVSGYVQKHLSIKIDGKTVSLRYLGYEQIEEAIYSYWEIANVADIHTLNITDNILYDYKKDQVNIVHVTVKGTRKSSKLNNPDDKVGFEF